MFGRGGGGGHHSGGGGGHRGGGGRHHGGGRAFRSGGYGPGYAYPVYADDCDLFFNPNTGQMECVVPNRIVYVPTPTMSGIFDALFGGAGSKEVGGQVLTAYFEEAQKYPEFTYPSFEAWLTYLESRVPDFVNVVGELVNSNSASTSVGQAADRLYALANDSGGQATIPQIVAAAGGKGDTINWAAAIPEVATESASQVLQTAQNVGTGVLKTVNMTKYLPWILGGGALLYIFVAAKGASASVSKLIDAGTETVKSHAKKNPRITKKFPKGTVTILEKGSKPYRAIFRSLKNGRLTFSYIGRHGKPIAGTTSYQVDHIGKNKYSANYGHITMIVS